MKTETLLAILFANNLESVVALAVKIDNNIDSTPIPTSILVAVQRSELPAGKVFDASGNPYEGGVVLPVISHNKYMIDKPFTVQLPNGAFKQVNEYIDGVRSKPTIYNIIDKPEVKEAVS